MNNLRQWLILCVMLLAGSLTALAQHVAVKTNALGWAATNANLGVEIGLAPRWTLNVTGEINPWNFSDERHFKSWNAMPEARFWFCERFSGHFLGLHLVGGQYNAKNVNFPLKSLIISSTVIPGTDPADAPVSAQKGWPDLTSDVNKGRHVEGWFGGGGITYGYQWMLAKHWNLEASLGVGYAYSKMKFYGRCARVIDERKLHYVGPTHATLAILYCF